MPYTLAREWIDSVFVKDNLATCVKTFINVKTFYPVIAFLGFYAKCIIGTKMIDSSHLRGPNPGERCGEWWDCT